jgi:hypothetical protein
VLCSVKGGGREGEIEGSREEREVSGKIER